MELSRGQDTERWSYQPGEPDPDRPINSTRPRLRRSEALTCRARTLVEAWGLLPRRNCACGGRRPQVGVRRDSYRHERAAAVLGHCRGDGGASGCRRRTADHCREDHPNGLRSFASRRPSQYHDSGGTAAPSSGRSTRWLRPELLDRSPPVSISSAAASRSEQMSTPWAHRLVARSSRLAPRRAEQTRGAEVG